MQKRELNQTEQFSEIQNQSGYSLIFKHSTRCPISSMALNRIEGSKSLKELPIAYYFLDLIKHRDLSNQVAATFDVPHESPQIILIKNGEVVLDASHNGINPDEISQLITK